MSHSSQVSLVSIVDKSVKAALNRLLQKMQVTGLSSWHFRFCSARAQNSVCIGLWGHISFWIVWIVFRIDVELEKTSS